MYPNEFFLAVKCCCKKNAPFQKLEIIGNLYLSNNKPIEIEIF